MRGMPNEGHVGLRILYVGARIMCLAIFVGTRFQLIQIPHLLEMRNELV